MLGRLHAIAGVVGTAVAAIFALQIARSAAQAGASILNMGGDAVETASLIENSLGPAAEGFAQRIADIADATNRSKFELAEHGSIIVAMTRAMGASQEQASSMSATFSQMAVDLGSFFNQDTATVFEDIRSALAGSSEPMQKYGLDVRETTLKQIALNHELVTSADDILPRLVRAQAIAIAIQEQASDAMGDAERTAGSFQNQLRGLQADIRDTATEIGVRLLPTATKIISGFKQILPAIEQIAAGVAFSLAQMVEVGIAFVRALMTAMGVNFGTLADDAGAWGENIVVSLAAGMAAAASAVIAVLNYIGQIIAYWLAPGSPPRLLRDLPMWGASAMTEFMQGWASGDFSVFNDIAGVIESRIRSLASQIPETDLIPRILGARSAIAEAIQQVNEVGEVSEAALQKIFDAAGIASDAIQEYIVTLFELEEATAAVERAQEILQQVQDVTLANWQEIAAELEGPIRSAVENYGRALGDLERANREASRAQAELNRLNDEYAAILNPLNAQLQGIRDRQQDLRDEEDLADIRRKLASENLTAAEREALMLREKEILLQQQIRDAERQRDTEVGAAEERLEAAEEAQRAAEEEAERRRELAVSLAQAEADAASAHLDALQEQADAQRALIDIQTENNRLVEDQLDLLERLAEKAGGAGGKVAKGLKGAGDALKDLLDGAGGAVGRAGGVLDIFADKFDSVFERIQGKFDPVIEQAEELGNTWGRIGKQLAPSFSAVRFFIDSLGSLSRGDLLGFLSNLDKAVLNLLTAFEGNGVLQKFHDILQDIIWGMRSGQSPLEIFRSVLANLIPPETIAQIETVARKIVEFVANLVGFVTEHKDTILAVLAGIAAGFAAFSIITTVVGWITSLIAFFSGLGTAIATAGGIIAAIIAILGGPLTIAIALVSAAIGLLTAAWIGNWFGIRDAVAAAWNNVILPAFQALTNFILFFLIPTALMLYNQWVTVWWPAISTAIATAWNDYIKPAFEWVRNYLADNLIPILLDLYLPWVSVWWPEIQAAINTAWNDYIKPAMEWVHKFLVESLIPKMKDLWTDWTTVWWPEIQSAIDTVWTTYIKPAFEGIYKFANEDIPAALGWLNTEWDRVMNALQGPVSTVKGLVDGLLGAATALWEFLRDNVFNFRINVPALPDWAIPGSPLPIHTAWKNFAAEMNRMTVKPRFDFPSAAQVAGALTPAAATPMPAGGGGIEQRHTTIYGGQHFHEREQESDWLEASRRQQT